MSTTVDPQGVWLNVAEDLDEYLYLEKASGFSRTKSVDGYTQKTGSGALRFIGQVGQTREWSIEQLKLDDPEEVKWLEDHVGVLVCARDYRGHKFYAVYTDTSMLEHGHNGGASTTLKLTEVTFPEDV